MSPLPTHTNGVGPRATFPLSKSLRQKPRKWPLVFRFIKGAIHYVILIPVLFHTLFTIAVLLVHRLVDVDLALPSSIVPSLSIVVGLMLVFRNSSSYERYWGGRTALQQIVNNLRNLVRTFLVCGPLSDDSDRVETERTVKTLVAMLYAVKNHLRGNWEASALQPEFASLMPEGFRGHEAEGVGLPMELAFVVERYIKRGVKKGAFNAPQSANLNASLNAVIMAYGNMETIKLTPIPVCQQIHQKQVLALYCCVLPFCLLDDMGWWTIPVITLVCFTLYGIEGIGEELEDPFGNDRNDIKIDAIIEDCRQEVMVLLESWKRGREEYYL
ncbi:unnamed protein product [Tuber melanosporum]|uniref:(Perigord truffle) hypothetical protein n=1 Tax=Tuber melanosporum (strain Mel28) TaxID=656061 RepID=D5GH26_TUBMM|nr:uncharacterized protein GSTUM_00007670001 [Tuber melanosporum]CAZ83819.1 unnamed protein product [Tuber melanosporum]